MAQININDLTYYYDDFYHAVFEDVTLNMDSDWKLGLIGRNGRGKSTLLNLLAGSISPSKGKITFDGVMSKYPYSYHGDYKITMDVIKECIGNLRFMEMRMEALLLSGDEKNLEEYFELQEKYTFLGGYEAESNIKKELDLFGFDEKILEREYATLSGGEKSCMLIIALFLRKDSFVLLDEPTNHLDADKKEILMNYLKSKKGYVIVTHDFAFLDEVSDHILAINKCDISLWKGNYSSWRRHEDEKLEAERREEEKLIDEIDYLENHAKLMRKWSASGNTQKYDFTCHARANGNKSYMRQAKRSEGRIQEDIESKKLLLRNLEEEKDLRIMQNCNEEETLLHFEDFTFGYDKQTILFEHLRLSVFTHDRVWIRGKNGSGKSTLIKLILGEIENQEITYKEAIKIAYSPQEPVFVSGMILDILNEENYKYQVANRSNDKTHCKNDKTYSKNDKTYSNNDKTYSNNDKTHSNNDKTHSNNDKTHRKNDKIHSKNDFIIKNEITKKNEIMAKNESTIQDTVLNKLYSAASKECYNIPQFKGLCDSFDLPEDLFTRPLETLSSGELKKVNIAAAISKSNDILILDEPLNYMDALFKAQLEKTLIEQNLTVLFVDHDKTFGRNVATKMLYLG